MKAPESPGKGKNLGWFGRLICGIARTEKDEDELSMCSTLSGNDEFWLKEDDPKRKAFIKQWEMRCRQKGHDEGQNNIKHSTKRDPSIEESK